MDPGNQKKVLHSESSIDLVVQPELPTDLVSLEPESNGDAQATSGNPGVELLSMVGEGMMGTVYRAKVHGIESTVAVKMMRPSLLSDPAARKRFRQEALASSQLTHANIAAVYAQATSEDGTPFLVMDYIDGVSLSSVLAKEGALEPSRACHIFIQIADALEHAHKKGVLHRDIKPSNVILVNSSNANSTSDLDLVKIVDFGIAKILSAPASGNKLTQTAQVLGSPAYMSPEQGMGLKVDERSDVYSLGCLMFESLVGKKPFQADNPIQILFKQVNEKAPNMVLKIADQKLAKGLQLIVACALQKKPELRYQSMAELRRDLEALSNSGSPRVALNRRRRPAINAVVISAATLALGCATWIVAQSLLPHQAAKSTPSAAWTHVANPQIVNRPSGAMPHVLVKQITDKYGRVLYLTKTLTVSDAVSEALRNGVSLAGADIYNVEMSGSINNALLQGAHFRWCKIDNAIFEKANLQGADFKDCVFTDVQFNNSAMDTCDFENSKFVKTVFTDSHLKNATFEDCDAGTRSDQPMNLAEGETALGATMNSCWLDHAKFIGGHWSNCRFNSDMTGVIATFLLTHSIISATSFGQADFSGADVVTSHIYYPRNRLDLSRF